ncbi:MAG: SEL1-like repeat protein [Rhizobiales bacterium]|nr:SEL1-like repeat protein [Hyphomicrobiales bacterium]
MDSRRTYLDTLNVGRQRRTQNSLDDLNRSLERLGERLDRRNDRPRDDQQPRRRAEDLGLRGDPLRTPLHADPRADMQPGAARDDAYQASTGRLAAEIKGLRDELRQQMTSGLQREFESLRSDIARASAASSSNRTGNGKLAEDLERLSQSVQMLSGRNDEKNIDLLRHDIEHLRAELEQLAREDTVRSMDSRWDQLDRRWHELESRLDSRPGSDLALAALSDRLAQINEAVNNLPESLSLRSLEDKVRILAGSVEHFAQAQDNHPPRFLSALEQRLDEISRAIVASATPQPPAADAALLDRIENRIFALSAQLEELAHQTPSTEIIDRLNTLSQRVEEVASQADVPARSMEHLASQIALIADKIDAGSPMPDADEIMRSIEHRFDQFADALEQRQDSVLESSQSMFRDLEARLFDVVSKLDQAPRSALFDDNGLIETIEARLDDFSRRLDTREPDRDSMRELEAKIDTISDRIAYNSSAQPQIDPEAIRNLENQVAGLSAYLSKPDTGTPILDSLAPRLEEMERAIRENRDSVVEAARRAAEDVARSFSGSPAEAAAVSGLANDLKSLEQMARRSDDRNSKTFEAIHDTLLRIVDRLGSLETTPVHAALDKITIADAPSIDTMDADEDHAPRAARRPEELTPAAMASAAAAAALADTAQAMPAAGDEPDARGSLFGGLGRALRRKKKADARDDGETTAPAMQQEPTLELDQPLDPKAANRPLKPGSGAPDLSSIVKRVREERGPKTRDDEDTARVDFIAHARRNAQAAAAEAEVLKRHSEIAGKGGGSKLSDILKARRKPILMGALAVVIALGAMHLGKAFFADAGPGAHAQLEAPVGAAPDQPASSPSTDETNTASMTPIAPLAETGTHAVEEDKALAAGPPQDSIGAEHETAESAAPPAVDTAAQEPAADGIHETAALADSPDDSQPAVQSAEKTADDAVPAPAKAEAPAAAEQSAEKAPQDAGPAALREAADAGDPKALFEIGARYSEGRGTKADNAKAAKWYERAAALGLAPAQYRIGNMYEKGVGVTRDLAKAKTWYQMAAQQGNASAMHNLAVLFAMGADGSADNESAVRWFTRAAELGVKDSQFNLGILTAKGVGMPQNLEDSYKWFALVAKTGDRDAAAKRDEIAKSMRPEQLEKARAAAELWKPAPMDAAANTVDIPDSWKESQEKTAGIDMKKAIKTIQLILNKNGYDAGNADGVMGGKTKTAIIAFQKDNNLPADGEVTEQLVKALIARK